MNAERRFVSGHLEVRTEGDTARITGYASVFNRDSEVLGYFIERVAPGAFKKTIKEADVRALFNHDPSFVLGRTKSGTLKLSEDDTGLHYEVDANMRKQSVKDLVEDIDRGDITQSSFGFRTIKDEWDYEDEPMRRTLREVSLFDVSPVTFPAYPDATSQVERALRSLATDEKPLPELVEACKSGELRSYLLNTPGDIEPAAESEEPPQHSEDREDGHSSRPDNLHVVLAKLVTTS
jgi:HK97 family phage prohead protease